MCIKDLRLGRFIRTKLSVVVLTTASQQVLESNNNRVFANFYMQDTSGALVITPGQAASIVNGFTFTFGATSDANAQLMLNMREHGDVCTKSFHALISTGTSNLVILEGFATNEMLDTTLRGLLA